MNKITILIVFCAAGPPGQDDVRLARHEDELQAAGRAGAHHLQHLLLRAVQPHLQSARAPDEALQQPGESQTIRNWNNLQLAHYKDRV